MPVTIRLRRVGRNKQSNFRVVVTEKTAPRDGAYLEAIGFYNPRPRPAQLRLDLGKLDEWIGKGAEVSDTVASLARRARRGGDRTVALMTAVKSKAVPEAEAAAVSSPRAAASTASEPATPAPVEGESAAEVTPTESAVPESDEAVNEKPDA